MVTIKDYATSKGVSYEAVRKQVKTYAAELEDHITKKNRTQFLDEFAIEFLDNKRAENPIVIINEGREAELQALREENKALLVKIATLQEQIIAKSDKIEELQDANIKLLQTKTKRKWWQIFDK